MNVETIGISDHVFDRLMDDQRLQDTLLSILRDDRILGWSPRVADAIGQPEMLIGGGFNHYTSRPYPVLHMRYRNESVRVLAPENVHLLDELLIKLMQVTAIKEIRVWDDDRLINVWWDGKQAQVGVE